MRYIRENINIKTQIGYEWINMIFKIYIWYIREIWSNIGRIYDWERGTMN